MIQIENYIDGKLVAPLSGKYLDNINPATEEVYSQVPASQKEDVLNAIAAAKKAFPAWSKTSVEQRIEYFYKIAAMIRDKHEELALAESRDNGKPVKLAMRVDIPRAWQNLEFYAKAMSQFHAESYVSNSSINYTTYNPLGVVTCISPWNLPLYLFTWKIAPALITGNTVVAKPSEVTPMTAYLFSQIVKEAGLPDGVLNILHGLGPDMGDTLVGHEDIKAVSFTGSTATGKYIANKAAESFKKVSLEMGGKNPNIVFDDCDYEKALKTTIHSSFANQGQICLCGSRIYVQKSIYDKFKNDLAEAANKLKIGDPTDSKTAQGAVVSKSHYEKILSYIEIAKKEGGTILSGGEAVEGKGYFIKPTLIENLDINCQSNQDEIFGPVATITPFETESDVIAMANGTRYGLSATVWTGDVNKAHRVASEIDAGIVWVNCWLNRDLRTPFGGVKNSGLGREGGKDALHFFTEVKNTCIQVENL
jgi:aminomuconate-semialdehyde/2-hydroxymuconate-6-semialdehyde dehydrogenase